MRDTPSGSIVLAVDDDPVSRRVLESALLRAGYEVLAEKSAETAQQTFDRIGPAGIGCVVTDYHMPGINGVDLRSWIWLRDPSISAILVTAEGEQRLVEESLRAGFADFLNKPLSVEDLLRAVDTAMRATHHRRELAQMEQHVEAVARTQRQMLTSQLRGGLLDIEVYARPKYQAGGDFLSHIQISPTEEVVIMADVSGHDLSAAYTSAYFQGMVRGMLECQASLDQVFHRFNRFLAEEWTPDSGGSAVSISACSLHFDRLRGEVTAISCGAPFPVIADRDGHSEPVGNTRSFPLGWFAENPIESCRMKSPASSFLLWTDGLEELAKQLSVSPLSLTRALLASHRSGAALPCVNDADDDIMAARVRFRPGGEYGRGEDFEPLVSESYPAANVDDIDFWQLYWTNSVWLALPDANPGAVYDAILCSREAVLNALHHGCKRRECATFEISYCDARGRLRVRVSDPGPGHDFEVKAYASAGDAELADWHRGLLLIRSLCREFRSLRRGAELIMEFNMKDKGQTHE